jgi:hypothetical protein
MSKKESFDSYIKRNPIPKDCKFIELKTYLIGLGFELRNKGRTSGSRILFLDKEMRKIMLHKPHGSDPLCPAALKDIREKLIDWGYMEHSNE